MTTTTAEETKKKETSKTKKSELLLDSLEIKGYRCFEHLTIEKLGRVNLIVGKNNVGKTALLEGLWIYANSDDYKVLNKIIFDRNEVTNDKNIPSESLREYGIGFRNLFFNRPPLPNKQESRSDSPYFVISPLSKDVEILEDNFLRLEKLDYTQRQEALYELSSDAIDLKAIFVRYFYDFSSVSPQISFFPKISTEINNLYVNSSGIDTEKQVGFWDQVALTPLEDDVIKALSILLPKIKRLDFIGYSNESKERVPFVRLGDEKERVPLKSFGEGLTRILGLSLALVQCKDGFLFIDEVENGLHYSALLEVWKLIFKTAKDLNVQVFATTHSKDCVEAFAAAAEESPEDGMLIRLERRGEKIIPVTVKEENLVLAVEYGAEVR